MTNVIAMALAAVLAVESQNGAYLTAQYAQCWRDGHAQGKAEMESGGTE